MAPYTAADINTKYSYGELIAFLRFKGIERGSGSQRRKHVYVQKIVDLNLDETEIDAFFAQHRQNTGNERNNTSDGASEGAQGTVQYQATASGSIPEDLKSALRSKLREWMTIFDKAEQDRQDQVEKKLAELENWADAMNEEEFEALVAEEERREDEGLNR
jgi:hypothetical protein